ncbi:GerAB/ArcD/ProY family transporter [Paenibacillus sp. J22TS3]|uniref:GerAB/ArcD/ProY family transporter n=1 Tax=Paenibacillus sp. J22TS3 TaxID=2807192 RepID=UPI001B23A100|nr:GerAB/ArcD/ProY family transporter [Paenibacillus sp. J22TS3]GIP22750.1 hypothetical protein J22TS3_30250 [Paenibacillus sp. J22TS3]
MVKSKYFYYLFLINALINIINFVPRGLISHRFSGAIMSILVAVPIGTLFTYLFVKGMSKFPQKGLPEILNENYPRILSILMLLGHVVIWYIAGLITLLSFVDVSLRYISSDVPPFTIMIGFLVVVCLSIRLTSESIMYALEVLIVLNIPLIIYFLLKGLLNPYFSWDAVMQIVTYSWTMPSFDSIAQATFIFSGYINLALFNRVFKNLRVRHFWLIGVAGFLILLVSFLVPIGYLGTIGVERHVYPWFSTADVLRTRTFIVERILFIFYFTYLTLSLVSTIVHWHVALEFAKGIFVSRKQRTSPKRSLELWIIIPFSIVALLGLKMGQFTLDHLGLLFLDVRFIAEMLMIMSIYFTYWLKRRRRKT